MRIRWFRKNGYFFLPYSVMGYIVLAIFIAVAVRLFISIDSRSHSVSDTLLNVLFNYVILGAVYHVIGYLTSPGSRGTQ